MNDIVSSDEEWEESDYGNPTNASTNSSFKKRMTLKKWMNKAKRS
ncbi:hypothetical protein Tco_0582696, partial [Tanacetum coccineum]